MIENLTVRLHVFYILNIYVKLHSNWTLFTIGLINLFLMCNFRQQKLEI